MFNFLYYYFFYNIETEKELETLYNLSLFKHPNGKFYINGFWHKQNIKQNILNIKKVNTFNFGSINPILLQLSKLWHSNNEKDEYFWKNEWTKYGKNVQKDMDELQYFTNSICLFHEAVKLGLPDKYYNSKTNKCLIPLDKNLKFFN
uniref:Uncharacterized protein n=1 Tax=viral metagenome TaxID=1070528 RepID=A0A6C0J9N2_9ZZZZ